jgi:hypothetical protein
MVFCMFNGIVWWYTELSCILNNYLTSWLIIKYIVDEISIDEISVDEMGLWNEMSEDEMSLSLR